MLIAHETKYQYCHWMALFIDVFYPGQGILPHSIEPISCQANKITG